VAAGRLSPKGLVWRRRAIAIAIVLVAIIAGYYLWLRDSSVVAVEDVKVEGATVNQEQLAAALESAAHGMTTLHVDDDELRRAVQGFPTVATIKVDASLLHSLTITVTERLPVAQVRVGGEAVAVAGDGYLLPGVPVAGEGLPVVEASAEGGRLNAEGSAVTSILGATPAELRDRIVSAAWEPELDSVVVEIEGAPELRFGDGERAEDKWVAVVAVLSKDDLGSPAYLDVSVPERVPTGG